MTDVDYIQKIRNFQNLTDNYNEEEALNYLEKTNWDEKTAAENYKKSKNKKKEKSFNNKDEAKDELLDYHYNESQERTVKAPTTQIESAQSNQGYISRFFGFLSYLNPCSKA